MGHKIQTKVTIIMPVLNRLEYTRLAVDSLFTNTDLPFRLMLVDNGSDISTITTMMSWELSYKPKGLCNKYGVVMLNENTGYPHACNVGMKRARTPYVLICNNDVYFPPNWLSPLVYAMDADPSIAMVGPASSYAAGEQGIYDEPSSLDTVHLSQIDAFASSFMSSNNYSRRATSSLVGLCLLLRRDAVRRIGYMDEQFYPGQYDDVDLNRRLHNLGYKRIFCPASFVWHFGHKTFEETGVSPAEALQINRKRYQEKWQSQ